MILAGLALLAQLILAAALVYAAATAPNGREDRGGFHLEA